MIIEATGTVNDRDIGLPDGPFKGSGVQFLFCNNASLLTITGITGAVGNQPDQNAILWIVSKGAGQVDIANQAAGSTAQNRIITGVTGTISLAAGVGRACLVYDSVASRWRVIQHEQGAAITPAYSAGNFTGASLMTWTVDAGDVQSFSYHLRGRMLFVQAWLSTTTVGGTLSSALIITIPGGFVAAKSSVGPGFQYIDNGATQANGWIQTTPSVSILQLQKFGAGNFSASTNNTHVYVAVEIEVQ